MAQPAPARRKTFDWSFWLVVGLTALSVFVVWRRDGVDMVREVITEDAELFLGIIPKVVAGTLIGELIRRLVPRETIVRWLGEGSGLKGLIIASLAGALFPAGPFTIFPLATGLLLAGADRGAAVAFITGWLLLGVNRIIIWELPLISFDMVSLRVLVSWWIPLAAGWLARLWPFAPPKPDPAA